MIEYMRSISLSPNDPLTPRRFGKIGYINLLAGKTDISLYGYQKAITITEQNKENVDGANLGDYCLGAGIGYVKKNDFSKAKQYFKKSIELFGLDKYHSVEEIMIARLKNKFTQDMVWPSMKLVYEIENNHLAKVVFLDSLNK